MDKIAILDCGGQYAHLIGNRVRRLQVYSEILPVDVEPGRLKEYKGVILSGGPQSVYEEGSPQTNPAIFELGIPMLGICYGEQLMIHQLGGEVKPGKTKEYGPAMLDLKKCEGIFKDFESVAPEKTTRVWMSHGDEVVALPEGFEIIGSSADCTNAAVANFEKNLYGAQFHLEVTHSEHGMKMLENFLDICGCSRDWSIANYIDEQVEAIKTQAAGKKVFLLASGGVDSTVAFLLINKALGPDNVYGLFVDTGFMRAGERDYVESSLKAIGFENLHVYDASKEFFEGLKDQYSPETKREIIGRLFLEIQKKVVAELGLNPDNWLLGQGTIYPDTIESGGTKHASKIKTHHNRVPEIEKLIAEGKIIEPLVQLYKDEVREVGEKLGLSKELTWRHPFPGPGLAVRCLCAQTEDYPENHVETEGKITEFVSDQGLEARMLPLKSVGVQGDARSYRHAAALFGRFPEGGWDELEETSTAITNRFFDINRVLLMASPERFDSVTVQENSYLTPERISLLQKADKVVWNFLIEKGINQEMWQFPVVLVPVAVNAEAGEAIVLRPVCSQEAMTADFYKMKKGHLDELVGRLREIEGVTAVFYDISNKPPGTIEWE